MRWALNLFNEIKDLLLDIKSSYWFLPSLMTLASFGLAFFTVYIDQIVDQQILKDLGLFYLTKADGARAILSTIAGSVMTVAGVTFSMTLVSVSHASSEIGPRILSGFMKDKGTQVTLGIFVATFVHCLMVLRTIQGLATSDGGREAFIPHISILTGILMALISVAALIYFIDHLTSTISKSSSVERIGKQLLQKIDYIFIDKNNKEETDTKKSPTEIKNTVDKFNQDKIEIFISDQGYLRMVQRAELLKIAQNNNLIIEQACLPGDYLFPDVPFAYVSGLKDENKKSILKEIKSNFFRGSKRTTNQDLLFPVDLLVEIAVRALSPGVNDPFTAKECINQLIVGLIKIDKKTPPSKYLCDENNNLRFIIPVIDSCQYLDRFCNQLRFYAKQDVITSVHLLHSLKKARDTVNSKELVGHINEHIKHLKDCALEIHKTAKDRELIEKSELV